MSEQIANTFIEALRTLESDNNIEPLAALYADNARVGNVLTPDKFQGQDGARRFWTEYRGTFDRVESRFQNVIAADGRAALEWTTEGTDFGGSPLRYSGVTILEADGDRLTRSCAYFDPAHLGHQVAPTGVPLAD